MENTLWWEETGTCCCIKKGFACSIEWKRTALFVPREALRPKTKGKKGKQGRQGCFLRRGKIRRERKGEKRNSDIERVVQRLKKVSRSQAKLREGSFSEKLEEEKKGGLAQAIRQVEKKDARHATQKGCAV